MSNDDVRELLAELTGILQGGEDSITDGLLCAAADRLYVIERLAAHDDIDPEVHAQILWA